MKRVNFMEQVKGKRTLAHISMAAWHLVDADMCACVRVYMPSRLQSLSLVSPSAPTPPHHQLHHKHLKLRNILQASTTVTVAIAGSSLSMCYLQHQCTTSSSNDASSAGLVGLWHIIPNFERAMHMGGQQGMKDVSVHHA